TGSEKLRETHKEHMLHHFFWYHNFNDEPNPSGKRFNLTISEASDSILIILGTLPVLFIDPLTGLLSGLLGLIHFFVF
ncbi:hypothetical protein, partial [Pseudoalteromonas distincta]|uniref:hypothetical protein n=1 Tax=Pseudoalteromonas distincta TaxID=77608 RepID=UPI0034E8532D